MGKNEKIKIYQYGKCSTCVKAIKFLRAKGHDLALVDITESPPSKAEIKTMLSHVGDPKKLFNTSGVQYRELALSAKLPSMTQGEMIDLLASNGRLVKRPFVLHRDIGLVGFKEDEWKKVWS